MCVCKVIETAVNWLLIAVLIVSTSVTGIYTLNKVFDNL